MDGNKPCLTLETTRLEKNGALAWVVAKNTARRNAWTRDMWAALPGLVVAAESDPSIRVLILRGAGDIAFSSGADISEFATTRIGAQFTEYEALNEAAFQALMTCRVPTLAMIHGFCLGGGLGLALACDLRFADDAAEFAIPAAKLGLAYNPRWMRPLVAMVGPAMAKEILFTGRRFTAAEALAMGLINRVFSRADLYPRTLDVARDIAANAPLSLRAAKQAVDGLMSTYADASALAKLDVLAAACFESRDYEEGCQAFMEKRAPMFEGR